MFFEKEQLEAINRMYFATMASKLTSNLQYTCFIFFVQKTQNQKLETKWDMLRYPLCSRAYIWMSEVTVNLMQKKEKTITTLFCLGARGLKISSLVSSWPGLFFPNMIVDHSHWL